MRHDDLDPSSNGHGPRPKYLTGKAPQNDVGPLVLATTAELQEIIAAAVTKALDERDARGPNKRRSRPRKGGS